MKEIRNDLKHVHYVTYEYDDVNEKEEHICKMGQDGYEILERFEDYNSVIYRKFYS